MNVTTKTRMAGLRADEKTLASWARKAKAAGMSFNKWAHLVLNTAPEVKPAVLTETPLRKA
jgi:predicted HicB family RNase H-like nuclease